MLQVSLSGIQDFLSGFIFLESGLGVFAELTGSRKFNSAKNLRWASLRQDLINWSTGVYIVGFYSGKNVENH